MAWTFKKAFQSDERSQLDQLSPKKPRGEHVIFASIECCSKFFKGLVNRYYWMQNQYPISPEDVLLFKTSISFVDHIQEFLGAILAGALLIIPPYKELNSGNAIFSLRYEEEKRQGAGGIHQSIDHGIVHIPNVHLLDESHVLVPKLNRSDLGTLPSPMLDPEQLAMIIREDAQKKFIGHPGQVNQVAIP
ncbi:hypothetical protein HPP92_005380 [Vanilla planifolia]|uniref:Uncharacterized protein n=1 Tax=Vanilla planifolia TaxID=51239 RepID=A0A835RTY5_VANPL|nr:hypothetical protein HPP92_005380 [Vanilla planifolia]